MKVNLLKASIMSMTPIVIFPNLSFTSKGITLLLALAVVSCGGEKASSNLLDRAQPELTDQEKENEVWEMEEKYWEYVQIIDTVSYKNLWHEDFIGYPSFGDGVSDKSKIAIWIPDLHSDPDLKFSYKLYKKAVNVIEDVVIVFYDADEIWTDNENQIIRKETFKFTHTWGKANGQWVILGGMAAKKNQDTLND